MSHIIHVPRRFVVDKWGGTETVIINTARRLFDHDYSSEIVTPDIFSENPKLTNGLNDVFFRKVKYDQYRDIPIARFRYFYPFLGLSEQNRSDMDNKGGNLFSFSLMGHLMRAKKDVALFHLHTVNRLGGIVRTVAKVKGVPYVVSLHGGYLDIPRNEKEQLVSAGRKAVEWGKVLGLLVGSRRVLDDAAAIICVGHSEFLKMKERYPNKNVVYQPNGVDCAHYETGDADRFYEAFAIPRDRRLITCISRIDEQKNQILLVEAVAQLLPDFPDLHLVLIGPVTSTTYSKRLRQRIDELGLTDRVSINRDGSGAGARADSTDIIDGYAAAELFVLPSRHEPFGIVILEAWSAGCAVVASRVGGIPTFTEEGDDVLLFESENVADCTAQMRKVLSDDGLKAKLGDNGRHKARDQYDWKIITRDLVKIYDDALYDVSEAANL